MSGTVLREEFIRYISAEIALLSEVDVRGIDNHELNSLKIVDASAVVQTQFGDVILIMKQYTYHSVHRTIHSSGRYRTSSSLVASHGILESWTAPSPLKTIGTTP